MNIDELTKVLKSFPSDAVVIEYSIFIATSKDNVVTITNK